jgi:lycopene beta-cyclase
MGCAGLSLAIHMIHSGKFTAKRILLVDKEDKNQNDRTWCFWETAPGLFESIVHTQWDKAWFHAKDFSRLLELSPYRYKLIRGIDFYNYCLSLIRQHPNFEIR